MEAFYSILKQENIAEKEYERAVKIWKTLDCKSLGEYHDIYLIMDALLLADSFENFGNVFLIEHEIDPCYCYSTPGLTWECGLKYCETEWNKTHLKDDSFNLEDP